MPKHAGRIIRYEIEAIGTRLVPQPDAADGNPFTSPCANKVVNRVLRLHRLQDVTSQHSGSQSSNTTWYGGFQIQEQGVGKLGALLGIGKVMDLRQKGVNQFALYVIKLIQSVESFAVPKDPALGQGGQLMGH